MDKTLILNELKKLKNIKTDAEFARFLGIKPQRLRNWYERNTYDINILSASFPEVAMEYLVTGEGSMLKVDTTAQSFREASNKESNEIEELKRKLAEAQRKLDEQDETIKTQANTIKTQADMMQIMMAGTKVCG